VTPVSLSLVRTVAAQVASTALPTAALDDLMAWGTLAALEATVPSPMRIRGAMLDGARLEWGARGRARKRLGHAPLATPAAERPDQAAERADLARFVQRALATLPARERAIVDGVYWGDLTLEEAGAALGVQRAQACKLRAAALGRLKKRLGEAVL
jgi:RNA polymerase sigma factor (sigma-70 family)